MSAVSGFLGAQATSKAVKTEAQASAYATDTQYKMWSEAQKQFEPFLKAGEYGVEQLQNLSQMGNQFLQQQQAANIGIQQFDLTKAPDASYTVNPITGELQYGTGAAVTQEQLAGGGELLPTVPTLAQDINMQWDPDDPVYKYKQEQLAEQVNKQLASRGLYDSRAGLDVLSDATMNLASSEIDKQYSRAVGERDYLTQTAADQYSLGAQRGQTLYDRLYGQQSDLYSRMYGQTQTEDQRRLALLAAQGQSAQGLYSQEYQQALDLAKIGAGAATSAGQGAIQTGQGMAETIATSGVNQAQGALAQGKIASNTVSGLGSRIFDYYSSKPPAAQSATGIAAAASAPSGGWYAGDTSWGGYY